ncbi:MAG: cytochrome [Rhodocyclales bacterium]|nr:cytochrome [Rhodocyclales bacterium]
MTPNVATVHPGWLRITHWLNVIAVVILILSGWRIYNASPIFAFRIPDSVTLGGWLGGALLWHFAAMWLLVVNGVIYMAFNFATGRFGRKFFPLRPREVIGDMVAALKGKLAHDDLTHYNALQKLAYLFVIVDVAVIVLSGLVVWKSVQFSWLRVLMGGFDNARIVHFFGMAALVAFIVVHVIMVALVPKTFVMMVRGK